jgi:apolipoprotein N-acyltransferase
LSRASSVEVSAPGRRHPAAAVGDWEAITDWHAQQSPFRAVENGMALVRPTRKGITLATDSLGRTVGQKSDYFTGDDHTLVTSVPIQGRSTIYAVIGDVFAYACAAGLVLIAGWAARNALRSRRASVRQPAS